MGNNTYFSLLRQNRDYRFLWLGAVFSYFGDWFNLIASADLVSSLSHEGTAISFLFLARFLPSLLFSPVAGVLADRFDRRKLLIWADVLRVGIVGCFLLVRNGDQLWLFYGLLVGQFVLSTIFVPARAAILANIVSRQELVVANAWDSLTWSVMLTLGSLAGGVVASFFGRNTAFIIDALTFLLSALLIAQTHPRPVPGPNKVLTPSGLSAFVEGLRYVAGAPMVLVVSLAKAAGALAWSAINVLEVSFARHIFPLGASGNTTLGLIYAVSGIGTGVGPLLMRRWLGDAPIRLRWGIVWGFGCLTVGVTILSLAQSLGGFLFGTLIRTLGTGTLWVFSAVLLQMLVPNAFRGRVFAFEYAVLMLAEIISTLWAGFAQDRLGWRTPDVALFMAGVSLVVGLLWLVCHVYWLWRPAAASIPMSEE